MDKTSSVSQPPSPATGRKGLWWAVLVLSLAGLLVSAVLAHIHFKVNTQDGFHSFCGTGTTFNCDDVARTPYAILLGVPTAWWGIFGYLLAMGAAVAGLLGRRARLMAACGLLLATGFVAVSASMGAISAFRLRALCLLCAATYGINLLLFILAWVQAATLGVGQVVAEPWLALRSQTGKVLLVLILLGSAALALVGLFPCYWKKDANRDRKWKDLEGQATGDAPDGGHWIGAQNPSVTITEFSDYECPGCKLVHAQLRHLVLQFADQLRIIHRHFPLDQACNRSIDRPFHERACRAAVLAECAGRAGHFWEANDYLFEQANALEGRATKDIAADLKLDPAALEGCMQGEGLAAVKNDIEVGIALHLHGTPSFLVDGQVYFGNLPASAIERLRPAGAN
jgi:uncharacterized membrane protein